MSASPRLPHDDPGEDPYLLTLSSALPPPRALKDRGGAPWSLLLQQVTVRPGKIWQYQLFMVSTYRVWLRRAGFQMLAAGSYLTGAPGRLLHLWYVPPALAEGALAEQPAFLQHYREELIEHEETTTLAPAAYDPERALGERPAAAPELLGSPVRAYLLDTITVKPGQMGRFAAGKAAVMRPLLEDAATGAPPGREWFLVGAGWKSQGGSAVAVNLWSLPDVGALVEAMNRVGENTGYQRLVQTCVASEDQHLLLPMSLYDPRPSREQGRVVYPLAT